MAFSDKEAFQFVDKGIVRDIMQIREIGKPVHRRF